MIAMPCATLLSQLACVRECGASDSAKAVVMLAQLLGQHGSHHFDRITGGCLSVSDNSDVALCGSVRV